ncbi:possible tyrosine transporter P-protein [Desulfofundulus australicus DSM 11792]|uniref:Possible tyrosine transporter P-protein n=1 Tax=Desulfofundulus australicus DSM 11792 TaxID=1121425 RepID=A0A1M5AXK7_9FIRM|nr:ArsB/NhaD family transporter [Desulfofundulus australicus]SHF34955.1 possible tyrosine transporter P-protein [Desulfofundulus australicus DSM 11792]
MSEQTQVILATAVFLLTYAVIVSEKIHRTVVALVGAAIMVLTGILNAEEATHAIDFNTIGLLVGMMIIVGITRQTGVFEYLAIKAARQARGEPLRIMAALSLVTAVTSALLDNVTTVLLIVPVTFAIANQLQISPIPFLIAEIIASNIGGTATLIGDPPNIMIGSQTGLGFMDFVINLTPVVAVIYILTIFMLRLIYRRQLVARPELQEKILHLNEKDEIKDPVLLKKCLVVLALTIAGFVLHQYLHLESSVIALSGASLLLLLNRKDPEHALQAVEWPVIFFFAGLFVVVGALEKVGVIEAVARFCLEVTGGEMVPAAMLILWVSAIASAFVDNIPFVATMIPLIQDMGRLGGITDLNLLWWSLSLGACLGGNGTIIGASANVVVVGMAEKRGYPITFLGYMKVAFPLMIMSIVVSTVYLLYWHYEHEPLSLVVTLGAAAILAVITTLLSNVLLRREDRSPARTLSKYKEA